ncbi:MAG: hypothetical protein KH828_04940 [Clostridiales bacterium]|nr:hypothetical protein [Clostridiales bacterium]
MSKWLVSVKNTVGNYSDRPSPDCHTQLPISVKIKVSFGALVCNGITR